MTETPTPDYTGTRPSKAFNELCDRGRRLEAAQLRAQWFDANGIEWHVTNDVLRVTNDALAALTRAQKAPALVLLHGYEHYSDDLLVKLFGDLFDDPDTLRALPRSLLWHVVGKNGVRERYSATTKTFHRDMFAWFDTYCAEFLDLFEHDMFAWIDHGTTKDNRGSRATVADGPRLYRAACTPTINVDADVDGWDLVRKAVQHCDAVPPEQLAGWIEELRYVERIAFFKTVKGHPNYDERMAVHSAAVNIVLERRDS